MGRGIEAVTFDYWNTLCYEEPGHMRGRRLEAWSGLLEDAGYATERQTLSQVLDRRWEQFVARWTAGEQYAYAEAAAEIIEDLGYDLPPDVHDAIVEASGRVGDEADLHLVPNADTAVRDLKKRGVKVGIVCDVGLVPSTALRGHLERHGLLGEFDHWSFSDEVGHYKPSRAIFEHALDGLGAEPATTAHVGDLRRTDVAGALAMGMTAVRFTGIFDDDSTTDPEAHHVIADLGELVAVLGL
jgi:putative hydrolase of the HAD superfamily